MLGVIAVDDERDPFAEFFAAGEIKALQSLAALGLHRIAQMHLALQTVCVPVAPDIVFRAVRFLIQ